LINIQADLERMVAVYKWIHRNEMGEDYYGEYRQQAELGIRAALECYRPTEWARVEPQVALAATAHEWGKYDEAADWYQSALREVTTGELPLPYKDVYGPWIEGRLRDARSRNHRTRRRAQFGTKVAW